MQSAGAARAWGVGPAGFCPTANSGGQSPGRVRVCALGRIRRGAVADYCDDMGPRILLVLPTGSYRATAFLRAAERLGLEVVVASEEAPTLAGMMEGRVLTFDLGHPAEAAERAAEFARRWPVGAVVGVDEAAVLTAAHIAERLGLGRNRIDAVAATRDKRQMRARLAAAGVAQPGFVEIRGDAAGSAAPAAVAAVGLPAVVKPVDLAASRGVIRADSIAELAAAIARADALLRRPDVCGPDAETPLLVESFVSGAEVAVEGLLRDGRLEVLAVLDKPDPLDGPFFAETLYVTPSRHPPEVRAAVESLTRDAVAAVGLRDGPVHAELRLGPHAPVFLEVAARSIGGRCSAALPIEDSGLEMSLEELILRHAAGLPVGSPRLAAGGAGVLMLPVPQLGALAAVAGIEAARAVPGIVSVEVVIPPGEPVEPLPEGDRYLGFVVARTEDPAAAEAALRAAWSLLRVEMAPAGARTDQRARETTSPA